MCGIVGFIGKENGIPLALKILQRLEYRGYDSCGIAYSIDDEIRLTKRIGRISGLISSIAENESSETVIGHTRWATHGEVNENNAHPFVSYNGSFALAHNGIIENYIELKAFLTSNGYCFNSETDSEVIVNLLEYFYQGDTLSAIYHTLDKLNGSYALSILHKGEKVLYAVKNGTPLILGHNEKYNLICSDIPTIAAYASDSITMNDNEIAVLTADKITLFSKEGKSLYCNYLKSNKCNKEEEALTDYMLKEMSEIPEVLSDCIESYRFPDMDWGKFDKLLFVACGTSYHAALVAERMLTYYASDFFVKTLIAGEFDCAKPKVDERTLVVAISQSGETYDTLVAVSSAKKDGATVLSIVNVNCSSLTKVSDRVIYMSIGNEIAVASTKAYNASVLLLNNLMMDFLYATNRITEAFRSDYYSQLREIPEKARLALREAIEKRDMLTRFPEPKTAFYIGKNVDYFIALEGALKLKEISYVTASGYPSGELKHGALALIEKGVEVIAVITDEKTSKLTENALSEVKARGATVICVSSVPSEFLSKNCDVIVYVPSTSVFLAPILAVIPLQWLAYYTAKAKNLDADKPRNLAKSVTVH